MYLCSCVCVCCIIVLLPSLSVTYHHPEFTAVKSLFSISAQITSQYCSTWQLPNSFSLYFYPYNILGAKWTTISDHSYTPSLSFALILPSRAFCVRCSITPFQFKFEVNELLSIMFTDLFGEGRSSNICWTEVLKHNLPGSGPLLFSLYLFLNTWAGCDCSLL